MNEEMVSERQVAAAPATASTSWNAPPTRLIAGVSVPDSPLITAVIEYAQRLSEPYLFNHAMRSWLFAELIGRTKGIDYDREVVAVGTILHDIGLTAGVSGPNRFEVNGADAARSFIRGRGPLGSPCATDLGPGGAQLDAIARASQGAGGGGRHDGHRTRLRRLWRRRTPGR